MWDMRSTITAVMLTAALVATACSGTDTDVASDDELATTTTTTLRQRDGATLPEVHGPIAGEMKLSAGGQLDGTGYVEEEYFLSGDATAYDVVDAPDNGEWELADRETAEYQTRAIVRRPENPADFNGIVVVEWFNVTSGADAGADWLYTHKELLRGGYGYVGVTAQKVGADAISNDARYTALVHPGDDFSYDIFSQAGRAAVDGGLFPADFDIETMVAAGESQSAMRLVSYINGVKPLTNFFDGFFVHSRFSFAPPFASDGNELPSPAVLRTDGDVPILVILAEADVDGNAGARSDDGEFYRHWETAGTAHTDAYLLASEPVFDEMTFPTCPNPLNRANQWLVINAGMRALTHWAAGGEPPPIAPRIDYDEATDTFERDKYDNATGGIRLPDLEAPTATFSGSADGGGFCRFFGTTMTFDDGTIETLYPTHDEYVTAYIEATHALTKTGFATTEDEQTLIAAVEKTTIGN
jgi:hypothetical protein